MPYIKQEQRHFLDKHLDIPRPKDVGELNYIITQLCRDFLASGRAGYAEHNAVVGVLECAKLEFYRRAVSVYEDQKRDLNGEVYT